MQADTPLSEKKAGLIGMVTGDGCLYKSLISYVNKELELVQKFRCLMKEVYGITPSLEKSFSSNAFLSRVARKSVAEDLRKYCESYKAENWRVPKQIFEASKTAQASYLQALFDDDGTTGKREIRLISINLEALKQMRVLLEDSFGIGCQIYRRSDKNCYHLSIYGRENMKKFADNIGFYLKEKLDKLNALLERYNWMHKGWRKQPMLDMIIQNLAFGPASTSQIKTLVDRRGQTVWMHLIKLEKSGKVVRVGTTDNGSVVWALSIKKRANSNHSRSSEMS